MFNSFQQRQGFRKIATEVTNWIGGGQMPLEDRMKSWGNDEWNYIQEFIFIQGVAPYLYYKLAETETYTGLPEDFISWLKTEYTHNAERNKRIYNELHTFLAAANRAGVTVMPLKGILLSRFFYPNPALRPMADIDLLVHPQDRKFVNGIMNELGYQLIPTTSIYPNQDFYVSAGGEQVVNWSSEDPDNPRPFEIHPEIRRSLWGDVGIVDLTDTMWENSYEGMFLGEKVCLPSRRALFHHVATHAMQHFVNASGRLLMWLDLAMLRINGKDVERIEYINFAYPILRLAQRALPEHFKQLDLLPSAHTINPKLLQWCEEIALDDRCGLINRLRPDNRRMMLSLTRWNPKRWRLFVGYGDVPHLCALLQHASAMIRHYPHRARGSG